MIKKPNPELEDEDNPIWHQDDFVNSKPAKDVLPSIFLASTCDELLQPKGSSTLESPKAQIDAVLREFIRP
jgi:hypothetical protein